MFKYIDVSFPTLEPLTAPSYVMGFELIQNRYKHEVGVITFRDWGVAYSNIAAGTPVHISMYNGITPNPAREFYGYVHHAKPIKTPAQNNVEVTVISSSWAMKNEAQNIYTDVSADAIVSAIAAKYNFASFTIPHPRIYPQVTQTGISDWGLMVKLAKQCGYSLRTQNTEIYFEPVLYEFTNYRSEAPTYTMRDANNKSGWSIYSFEPLIGESLPYGDESKAAVAISGLDRSTVSPIAHTPTNRNKKTSSISQIEFFDRFDTHVVANNVSVAQYEAQAAEDRASFPYRAEVLVKGDHNLHPNMPIFLEGVGSEYETFWVVLSAEHVVKETSRNMYTYVTHLIVGTDALGVANVWTDNKQVISPATTPIRTIIPGATQTVVVPTTKLTNATSSVAPQLAGVFGTLKNRAGSAIPGATWATGTASLNPILTPVGSQAITSNPKNLLGTVIQ
jgi:hypothetical protein